MKQYPAVTAALALVATGAAAACGGTTSGGSGTEMVEFVGPPVKLGEVTPFYVPGEVMIWEITLHDIIGGEAVLAVGDPGHEDDRRVIVVRSRVESAGVARMVKDVRDEVTSRIDMETGRPVSHEADLVFGHKHTVVETEFLDDGYRLEYVRNDKPKRTKRRHLPADDIVHDGHSVLGALRAWDPEPGTRAYFFGLGGKRLWRNTIQFKGRESLQSTMGTYPTLRFEGVARRLTSAGLLDPKKDPRYYTLWVSDDADRLPLRVTAKTEYGDVQIELVDYQRPERTVVRR